MKKLTAFLLAMLLLALPFGSLAEGAGNPFDFAALFAAESETTDYVAAALERGRRVTTTLSLSDVTESFTDDPAVDEVIADVLNALLITGYVQGDETCFAISMKQDSGAVADLLTMGWALVGDDAYILSNLIGGTIVVGADEVVPVLERLVDMFVMLELIPEDEVEAVKAELPAMWQEIKDEFAAALASENALAALDPATLNYAALNDLVTVVMGKVTAGEPDVLPRNCDAAASMITVTLTPDDVKSILISCVQFVKDNPDLADAIAAELDYENTIAPEMAGMTDETVDFNGFLDRAIEEITKGDFKGGDIVIRIWLGEDGMPVAADCVMPITDGEETFDMTMNYTRLTMNDSVAHSVVMVMPDEVDMTLNFIVKGEDVTSNLALAVEGENVFDMTLDYTDRSAENLEAFDLVIDITVVEEEPYAVAYDEDGEDELIGDGEKTTPNIKLTITGDTLLGDVDFEEKVSAKVAVNGKEYLTLNVESASTEPGESIVSADVVRPAELSDADFANWFVEVYMSIASWSQNLMMVLPVSLINLMNTGY